VLALEEGGISGGNLDVNPNENPDFIEKGKTYSFWHPQADYRRFIYTVENDPEPLLKEHLRNGEPVTKETNLDFIRERLRRELDSLDQSYKRLLNPHIYKVSVTERLRALKLELIKNYLGDLWVYGKRITDQHRA
jgi:nicotinate phosphoribosyltransferase